MNRMMKGVSVGLVIAMTAVIFSPVQAEAKKCSKCGTCSGGNCSTCKKCGGSACKSGNCSKCSNGKCGSSSKCSGGKCNVAKTGTVVTSSGSGDAGYETSYGQVASVPEARASEEAGQSGGVLNKAIMAISAAWW